MSFKTMWGQLIHNCMQVLNYLYWQWQTTRSTIKLSQRQLLTKVLTVTSGRIQMLMTLSGWKVAGSLTSTPPTTNQYHRHSCIIIICFVLYFVYLLTVNINMNQYHRHSCIIIIIIIIIVIIIWLSVITLIMIIIIIIVIICQATGAGRVGQPVPAWGGGQPGRRGVYFCILYFVVLYFVFCSFVFCICCIVFVAY